METIVAQIKIEEERKRVLAAEYEALDASSGTQVFDYPTIVRELRERTADVPAILSARRPRPGRCSGSSWTARSP